MGRTVCTERQCLYKGALCLYLLLSTPSYINVKFLSLGNHVAWLMKPFHLMTSRKNYCLRRNPIETFWAKCLFLEINPGDLYHSFIH